MATAVGIVVGLEAEARVARPLARLLDGRIAVGGGGREGAQLAAERLAAEGVGALVSFGLAGGLDPALRPGALLVPAAVLAGGRCHACDPAIGARLGGTDPQTIVGGSRVLAGADAKRRLYQDTGAVAVDLESGAVALVAARHDLPFAVLRAVCDPAERDLPPAALIALDQAGRIGLLRVVASVLRRPGQMPELLQLAGDAKRARAALAGHLLGLRQGGPPPRTATKGGALRT